jgi:hypothetical protein
MSNLSYCQFENTYPDLLKCSETLKNKSIDELSKSEQIYAKLLIELATDIADQFAEIDDEDN